MTAVELDLTVLLDKGADSPGGPQLGAKTIGDGTANCDHYCIICETVNRQQQDLAAGLGPLREIAAQARRVRVRSWRAVRATP